MAAASSSAGTAGAAAATAAAAAVAAASSSMMEVDDLEGGRPCDHAAAAIALDRHGEAARRLSADAITATAIHSQQIEERDQALKALGDTLAGTAQRLRRAMLLQDSKAQAELIERAAGKDGDTDPELLFQIKECITAKLKESVAGGGKRKRRVWPRAMVAFLSIILACTSLEPQADPCPYSSLSSYDHRRGREDA